VRAARTLLCENSLKLGGVGINDSEDRRIFSDLGQDNYVRARILRQRKLSEYIIIDRMVCDDHQRLAEISWPMHSQVDGLSGSRN